MTGIFRVCYTCHAMTIILVMMSGDNTERPSLDEVNNVLGKIPNNTITILSALSEPNRMKIVELLRVGPMTVGEIANQLELRQPQTSKHLKVLSESGIVEVKIRANSRIYRLRPEPFQSLDTWIQSYLLVTQERYDNLDEYLKVLQNRDDL